MNGSHVTHPWLRRAHCVRFLMEGVARRILEPEYLNRGNVRYWPKADIVYEEVTDKLSLFLQKCFAGTQSGPDSIMEPVQILETFMNPRLIVAVFVIAAVPVYAQAQKPSTAKVTTADVQKVVTFISADKAKTQTYCDIGKLNEQIEEADEKKDIKKTEELSQQIDALGKKLGPEYAALMDRLQQVDPESEDGKRIGLMFEPLDKLCTK